jgi:hypothetical protein
MNLEGKIEYAIEEAKNAFWERVRNTFPEITTGDLSFDINNELDDIMKKAVNDWVKNNKKTEFYFDDITSIIDVDARRLKDYQVNELRTLCLSYKDTLDHEDILSPFSEIDYDEEPSEFALDFIKQAREACEKAGDNVCYVRLRFF